MVPESFGSDAGGELPTIAAVIPTHQTRQLTLRCLGALCANGDRPNQVVIVDDASSDRTAEAVHSKFPDAAILRNGTNLGFTRAANRGAESTDTDIILFLNSDTEAQAGTISRLRRAFAEDPTLGVAGAQLLNSDGSRQWSAGPPPGAAWLFSMASGLGKLVGTLGGLRPHKRPGAHPSDTNIWVSGSALAVRRSTWQQVGPFDERYAFYCQDLDLSIAAAAGGWRVALLPDVQVMHHRGASISKKNGAAHRCHPQLLWTDLLTFQLKQNGRRGLRRSKYAIYLGGWLRVLARSCRAPFLPAVQGTEWRRTTAAYRSALRAVRRFSPQLSHQPEDLA
jgi:hypothetical protein